MVTGFRKIRFRSLVQGETAGLVLSAHRESSMRIDELSKLYPMSEAPKLATYERGPVFDTWEEAFQYIFPEPQPSKRPY